MELYELLNFKTVCLVKAKLLSGVVFDQDLRALMEQDVALGAAAVDELESLYRGGADVAVKGSGRPKNDYLDDASAVRMPELADAKIAMDFLATAKKGVRNYALALTEATSQEVRVTLADQLRTAIDLYGETVDLMLAKGWLPPHDLSQTADADVAAADGAVSVANLKLFPGGGMSRRRTKIR